MVNIIFRGKIRLLSFVVMLAVLSLTTPIWLYGQIGGGGSIYGTIVDPAGAVVPKAKVTAINVDTGSKVERVSSQSGVFVLTPLIPGTYRLEVEAKSFAPYKQEQITVDALQITTVNVSLSIGTETITITVAPPPVNSTNAVVGDVVRSDDYQQLPLKMDGSTRCATCLVGYSAGEGNGYNGGTQYHNEIYIDGMIGTTINMQGNGNEINTGLAVEAVDQGEVQTAGVSAQYQGQGVVSFTSRSGSNKFHGSAFEYFRNTSLDAWDFASKETVNSVTKKITKPVEHQNEFGGALGGPILRNKLFFFASGERIMYTKTPNPTYYTIPTDAMRKGDFSAYTYKIYDPDTTTCSSGSCTRTQFEYNGAKNVIPPGRLSNVSNYLQQWLPDTTNDNVTNNYAGGFTYGFNYFKSFGKLDWNLSPSQHVAATYSTGQRAPNPTDSSGLPLPYLTSTATVTFDQLAMITHTWTINSHTVNDFKYGYIRYETCGKDPAEGKAEWAASAAGLSNYGTGHAEDAFPYVSYSGTDSPTGWDTSNKPTCTDANTYNIQDGIQTTRGAHSLSFGAQFEWYQYNATSGPVTGTNAQWAFSYAQTSTFTSGTSSISNKLGGSAYASYMLGYANSYYNSNQNGLGVLGGRFKSFSPFFQDDWKINRKLTLNLGLRWDVYSPWREAESRGSYFDANANNPITNTPGTLGFYGWDYASCNCSRLVGTYLGNVGPRFGFAYSFTPKTILRASYGISYTHAGGTGGRGGANNGTGNNGIASTRTISSSDGYSPADPENGTSTTTTWDTAIADLPGKTISPSWGTGYTTTSGYTGSGQAMIYADPYYSNRSAVYTNWNVGIQRALTNSTTLTIDYAASMGNFLPGEQNRPQFAQQNNPRYLALGSLLAASATDANIAKAQAILSDVSRPYVNFSTTATISQMLKPYPQFGGITDQWGNRAHSRYNAIEVGIKQRGWKGLTVSMNYTYSKLMDNENTGSTAYDISTLWQKNTQSPSVLNVYGTWKEPFGHTSSRLMNNAIKDWIISGIYTYSGGSPLSWTYTSCTAGSIGSCLPNIISGYTKKNARINGGWGKGLTGSDFSTKYIDSSVFSAPANYTLGSVFRNAYKITGQASKDLDLAVKRNFPVYRQYKMQFEVSAFNLTNHVEFGGLSTVVGASAFGKFTKQSNASRDIQLSARIDF